MDKQRALESLESLLAGNGSMGIYGSGNAYISQEDDKDVIDATFPSGFIHAILTALRD